MENNTKTEETCLSSLRQFSRQVRLLMWKRYLESTKSKWEMIKVFVPAIFFFVLIILFYTTFSFFADGGVEQFFLPFAFWMYIQRLVVQIVYEKNRKLQESMRMMGLSDAAYWISYFLADGVILGFVLSFLCSIITIGDVMFNGADFGTLLGFFFVFCLSVIPFCFFLASLFDTPQNASQITFALLFGLFVTFIIVFPSESRQMGYKSAQMLCCLVPPIALQIGTTTFLKSYDGIPLSTICGFMVLDAVIYSVLAWYISNVRPTSIGLRRPWYFPIQVSYWMPLWYHYNHHLQNERSNSPCQKFARIEVEEDGRNMMAQAEVVSASKDDEFEQIDGTATHGDRTDKMNSNVKEKQSIPTEKVNETILGAPTVHLNELRKSYGDFVAVNDLTFDMYENQIFALLGHNGAGKTTCMSMLTGLIPPDYRTHSTSADAGASVYGHSILSEMGQVRSSMGVCPQHDVLFDNLTVDEHILFFAQLKGATYEEAKREADHYTNLFHLEERREHRGHELSGGQRRKLSVAIAVCGGSKFVVLDEPTAGMDPLARRELWDLLAGLRKGRTMLLTTHYMDEADILGDRVGIMSHGTMQCVGSTQFLKATYGAGYKLFFDKAMSFDDARDQENLVSFVQHHVPEASVLVEDGSENLVLFSLPFDTVHKFGPLFTNLEGVLKDMNVMNYGVTITSLEDVFLKVGEDSDMVHVHDAEYTQHYGIGADREYNQTLLAQVLAIAHRRLKYAVNDIVTLALIGLPMVGTIAGAIFYKRNLISKDTDVKDLVTMAMYVGTFLGAPGLIAEFIVKEKKDKLRNVLTVMGCDFRAYWIGTFLADFLLMTLPLITIYVSWAGGDMKNFINNNNGMAFFIMLLFMIHLIAFSYFFTSMFTEPKSCMTFMPLVVLILLISPNIAILIGIQIANAAGKEVADSVIGGVLMWGWVITTPHGAMFGALLNAVAEFKSELDQLPGLGWCIGFMIFESIFFVLVSYYHDARAVAPIEPVPVDPNLDSSLLESLDDDVLEERRKTAAVGSSTRTRASKLGNVSGIEMNSNVANATEEGTGSYNNKQATEGPLPLQVNRIRKVFPPKVAGRRAVTAVQDVSFCVQGGEIFGLLGSNGAGKTTILSMLTRLLVPTSGDAMVAGHSVLSAFPDGARHLGVVTQNNSLWDKLSTEDHLYLFARLRGVPEDLVTKVVDATIEQLELQPHRKKLAMRLSGGMMRKLCVAIALIGDPDVVLLDEPSAGLDPVSRRNLWSVILRTMSHRAVILTTHSMDEAEALCKRIGIMVQGQLRALGTKQHLKEKFGSGYELVVKLAHVSAEKVPGQMNALNTFVTNMFPSAVVLQDNGGLVTYRIPKDEMKMGVAFTELQEHKQELQIEDYSIAQPTLEQVFIRTVHEHSAKDNSSTRS